MEKFGVLFGILSCVCMVLSQGDQSVYVEVEGGNLKVKPGTNITLNCIGRNGDVTYFIKNRVAWNFTNKDGENHRLSLGFYMEQQSAYVNELTKAGRLAFVHNSSKDGLQKEKHNFIVMISNLKPSDDGLYSCTLYNGQEKELNSSNMTVTVVSPVRRLRIELHDMDGIVAASESLTEGDTTLKITPGDYKVTCHSEGSNPKPQMSLVSNQDMIYVAPTHKKVLSGEGPEYESQFMVDQVTLEAKAVEQLLMCEGNIAGDFFPAKRAGLKLMVQIDKPHFMCDNLTTVAGERYRTVKCELHTKDGSQPPVCQHVFWKFGDSGKVVEMGNTQKFTDPNKRYNIMESKCVPSAHGLTVSLMMYTVEATHMNTTFYVVYGVGSDAEQVPIDIILKKGTNSATLMSPVTVLASLLMAVTGRLVARNL